MRLVVSQFGVDHTNVPYHTTSLGNTERRRRTTMSGFRNNFSFTKISLSLMVLLFVSAAFLGAYAQNNPFHDWSIPSAYNVENTGAHYIAPDFPSFDRLPIIRPLPDPFRFVDGFRST